MKISKQLQNIALGLALTTIGSIISFWTEWFILIPLFFGFSFPLVNIDKPFRQKFIKTLVLAISSSAILFAATLAFVRINFGKYIFPGILFGIAAVLILVINQILIKGSRIDIKTILLTFVANGLSLPTCIFFGGRIFGDSLSDINIRLYGIINFCLAIMTVAISIGLTKKPISQETKK